MANDDQLLQQLLLQLLAGQVTGGRGTTPPFFTEQPAGPPAPPAPPPLDAQGGYSGGQLRFPPESLTDQLNQIGAAGDALGQLPSAGAPIPPPQTSFDLLGGRSINTGGPLAPPAPQGEAIFTEGPQPPGPPAPPSPFSVDGGFFPSEAPLDPRMLDRPPPPTLEPAAPALPGRPERRPGFGGADELQMHQPRTPLQQEGVTGQPPSPGQLPTAPEKEGDLSRGRASRKLEELLAMQEISEGLGNMEVVTAGDILHKTAKGMGTKPRFKAEGLRAKIGMEAERDMMLYEHGLNLKEIKARGTEATKTAMATRVPARLSPTERGEWRGAQVAISELNEILQTKIDKKYDTGPLANAFENMMAFLGIESFDFAEKQEFKYRAARIVREYIFALSGKQTSGQERQDLMKLVPRGRDDDELFEFKIRGFQAFLKKKQTVLLESQPEKTRETENLRRMMEEEDKNDPYFHRRGGGPVYQIEAKGVEGGFFDVSKKDWEELMANPDGSIFRAVPLAPQRKH